MYLENKQYFQTVHSSE